jgi:glutamine---fructose-6-phosphate transaminase (isomerizing)
MSLSRVEEDIMLQPTKLRPYLRRRIGGAPLGSVLVGAGDSYLAACIANRLSSMQFIVLDPYELCSSPELARRRSVYFVSTSGRTTSNLIAAETVRRLAARRIAVTADPDSRLVRATDSSITLPIRAVPRQPGMLSFSSSLIALLKLTTGVFDCDFDSVMSDAKRGIRKIEFTAGGVNHFLGNGAVYPVCQYAELKAFEMTGEDTKATMLEEFGHSTVFGLQPNDSVNIFDAFDPLGLGRKLRARLMRDGFRASIIPVHGSNKFEQVFYCVFAAQLASLKRARAIGLARPHFVDAIDRLAISDALIY